MKGPEVVTFIRQYPEEILEALVREHRTHQQSTVGAISQILAGYGKDVGTDPRNEAAVEWSRDVCPEPQQFPFI
jgi:hypothetical protein